MEFIEHIKNLDYAGLIALTACKTEDLGEVVLESFPAEVADFLLVNQFSAGMAGFSVVLMIALFFIFIVYLLSGSKTKGTTVLMCGLPNSGKTTLLMSISGQQARDTHPSMEANTINLQLEDRTQKIVVCPGHRRLRKLFANLAHDAKTVPRRPMLQSGSIGCCRVGPLDVAEWFRSIGCCRVGPLDIFMLHEVMNIEDYPSYAPELIICLNKSESAAAVRPSTAKALLEAELYKGQ